MELSLARRLNDLARPDSAAPGQIVSISIFVYLLAFSPRARARRGRYGLAKLFDALPFGRVWYGEPNAVSNAIGYAMHCSRSHDAVIRVYGAAGNVIETYGARGRFKERDWPFEPGNRPRLLSVFLTVIAVAYRFQDKLLSLRIL